MIDLTAKFCAKVPLEKAWELFSDFDRFARCIPTLKSYQLIDATRAEGKVGVKLGILPVESRVYIEIKEKRDLECIQAEGISYLGETIVEQIRKGDAGSFDRDAVGRFHLHLDLRRREDDTLIIFNADVEAEGRLRKIYESIMKRKLDTMKREFMEKLSRELQCEVLEITEGEEKKEEAALAADSAAQIHSSIGGETHDEGKEQHSENPSDLPGYEKVY